MNALTEVITQTLGEHELLIDQDYAFCKCSPSDGRWVQQAREHVAEQVVAALGIEQAGWWNEQRGVHNMQSAQRPATHKYECYVSDVPVYRVRALDGDRGIS